MLYSEYIRFYCKYNVVGRKDYFTTKRKSEDVASMIADIVVGDVEKTSIPYSKKNVHAEKKYEKQCLILNCFIV